MVQYRRNRVAGGCYFFTVTLQDRRQRYLVEHVAWLREAFRVTMRRRPFVIDAIVVLPDHLHCIWTLPQGDDDYPARWQAIKAHFVKRLHRLGIRGKAGPDGAAGIWQRRYWEHTLRDEADFAHHVAYIHGNPVKHGLTATAQDWPFSSIHSRRWQKQNRSPDKA